MSGGRARNTASAEDLCKLMRLHVGQLHDEKYNIQAEQLMRTWWQNTKASCWTPWL